MAEKIHDQMVERTRRLIQDTMLLLIEGKGFSHVTIRNLTQKAQINRGTFYLHYLDKYDLIEQMEDELLNGLRQSMHTKNTSICCNDIKKTRHIFHWLRFFDI